MSILNTVLVIILSFLLVCLLGYAVIKLAGGYVRFDVIRDEEDFEEYIKHLQEELEKYRED